MTKEQAKRIVDELDFYLQNHTDDYGEREHDAMMMAIKALEQPTSDDCVSRQAVDELCFRFLKPNSDDNIAFYEEFCSLPPVTPTHKSGLHWIERFDNEDKWLECPYCHKDSDNAYDYCPNCGTSFKE